MKTQTTRIILDLPAIEPTAFITDYKQAVFEVMGLLFERRELDLKETQLHALSLLVRTAQHLEVEANR